MGVPITVMLDGCIPYFKVLRLTGTDIGYDIAVIFMSLLMLCPKFSVNSFYMFIFIFGNLVGNIFVTIAKVRYHYTRAQREQRDEPNRLQNHVIYIKQGVTLFCCCCEI